MPLAPDAPERVIAAAPATGLVSAPANGDADPMGDAEAAIRGPAVPAAERDPADLDTEILAPPASIRTKPRPIRRRAPVVIVDEGGTVTIAGKTLSADFPKTSGVFAETKAGGRVSPARPCSSCAGGGANS